MATRYFAEPGSGVYRGHDEPIDILIKVETHNHPTAIAPFPGRRHRRGRRDSRRRRDRASAPSPRRDWSATRSRICAFRGTSSPGSRASARQRASPRRSRSCSRARSAPRRSTTNSAGPCICGYFRTFEQQLAGDAPGRARGYHKPIMIAGGLGNVRRMHALKGEVSVGAQLVVLGGPAMLIGLGGGAASSMGSGASTRGSGFRLGAARQPRDAAARAGSHRRLLGAGRGQSDRADPRRRRRRPVQCGAGSRGAQRSRCAHRSARGAERRARHVAARDLVQRGAGALRAGAARPMALRASPRSLRASAARSRSSARSPTMAS